MALDLQLSTQKAREELQRFVASLTTFEQKLASAGKSGGGLETRLNQLAAFKGIEANAVASLTRLADGMTKLSTSASQINNVSRNLNSLARVRVDAVAANVEKISKALAGLRMPPNLERFATTLQRISTAATQAAGGMRQFAAAANSVRVPAGLNAMPGMLGRIGASARQGGSGMSFLSGVARAAGQALAGFGVVLGGFGFARFIQGTYEAVRAVDRFNNIVTATQGANQVGKEMAFIEEMATKLKLPIEGLIDSYGKFSAAAISTGESTENVHKIFEAMSTSARVLKLDQDQLKLAFRGLEQMYSKGVVSMEELRRQWGEQIPGGFAIAAKAMGITQAALTDLVASGQLAASDFIPKLAEELQKTFGGGLQNALGSAQAAMDNFGNAVFKVQEAFGRGFFDAFKGSLDGLATAMQDPAFIEGVKSFGNILGQVLNGAITVLKLLADNWDAVKFAIQFVLSLGVASVVNGWIQSLYNAGRVASLVAYNVGAMGVAFARLGFVQNLLFGLTAAMWALVRPAVAFVVAMGPLGWTILAAAVAIGIITAAIQDWAGTVDLVTKANNLLSQSTYDLTHWFENFITVPPLVREGLDMIWQGASEILKFFFPLGRAIELVQMAWEYFYPPAQKAAEAMDKTADASKAAAPPTKQVGDAIKKAGDSAGQGVPKVDAFGNQLEQSGDQAAGAIPELDAYAAAARKAAAAAASAQRAQMAGGSGGSMPVTDTNAEFFSGGGISHVGGTRSQRVPASAFINAPSFAGGGISDGIPAVLHPNEAVVPLAGGGTIPVQMMSGGQSSLMLLKPLQQLVDFAKQTKTEVARVWEATTVQTVLMKNAFGRIEQILSHIDNQRLVEVINAIRAIPASGGGAGGGGGFGSFPGGSGYGSGSAIDKVLAQMDAEIANVAHLAATVNNTGSGALTMVAGKIVADGSKAYFEAILPGLQAERDMIEARYRAGLLSEAEVSAMLRNLEKRMPDGGGFASGSPNASKDANGGFKATLHKDEAVIPLPDGRTVPVTIRSDAMDRITRFLDSGSTERLMGSSNSGGRQGNNVTIQVNMTVNVKDAESFRASRDQIMRDLKTDLDRAARTIGNRSDIDDPTRRM